jgi:ribonuclease HI
MLNRPCEVDLYSDSAYSVNGFEKGWIYNWVKNNWKTADKKPVKNQELWQALYNLSQYHKINFIKVKGHSDVELNNRCDELARKAIENL